MMFDGHLESMLREPKMSVSMVNEDNHGREHHVVVNVYSTIFACLVV